MLGPILVFCYNTLNNQSMLLLEPISLLHGRSTGSLDEITFEDDTDLHKELDDFFGPEAEVSHQ